MALLLVGAAAITLLLGIDTIRQRSGVADARQLQALQEVASEVAISHLWLEEWVSGDEVDEGEIAERLAHALVLVDSMIGSVGEDPEAPRLHTPELRSQMVALREHVRDFEAISVERLEGYRRNLPVGIGSALDVEYDRKFEEVLTRGEALQHELERHRREHQASARRLLIAIVAGWCGLLLLAATGIWKRERQRQRAVEELAESRRHLLQNQKMELAGRIAGGLAHDLANYLAAIRGHCEWVQLKHPPPERLDRKMASVLRTVDRATDLVDRLVAFARRRPAQRNLIDLGELVREVEQMLAPSLGDRAVLRLQVEEGLWPVLGDAGQIEQAVVNLVVNARDAMTDAGTIEIEVRNRPAGGDDRERDMVELEVADPGTGIPPEDRERIFEPFWTTKRRGGSGLGLAVVYGAVQQHGGRLEVESEVGVGTTFRWSFPRAPEPG